MFKNHFKIAWRNLLKHPSYSFINIFGLTLGVTSALLIFQYVKYEESYDRFHTKADRIYRLPVSFYHQNELDYHDAMNYAPTGPTLKNEMPEVEEFLRITPEYDRVVMRRGERFFEEEKVFYADSTLFDLFDYKLIDGDPETCLTKPYTVLLTKSVAERYFGPQESWIESPVGQTIQINSKHDLKITAIVEDVPENSHIKFNALLSFTTFLAYGNNPEIHWGWNDFYTYVLLKKGADVQAFSQKLPAFLRKHSEIDDSGNYDEFMVQPLADIHLKSNLTYEPEENGDSRTVYFLSFLAFAILFIAWVNYVNLATARAEERAKEVGVRKVIGAGKKSLVFQFLTEAFLINSFAVLLALGLVQLCQPFFPNLVGKDIPPLFFQINSVALILSLLIVAGTILSGLYPSFVLSAFSPAKILKGGTNREGRGVWLRKGLVTFQYAISVMLIAGTFIVYQQLNFMQQKDLGFSIDQKLVINAPSGNSSDSLFQERYKSFKTELGKIPEIKMVATSAAIPGKGELDLNMHGGIHLVGTNEREGADFNVFQIDEDFIPSYQMKIIAGRNFSEKMRSDVESVIVNQTAMRKLGIRNPEDVIGKKIQYWDNQKKIVGVVKDYHHKSLKHQIIPLILRDGTREVKYFSINYSQPKNIEPLIVNIQKTWNKVFIGSPFNYFFLDDHFNEQYEADQQLGKIVSLFSILTILIACLGLFGLASYTVAVRTKEIGIRKILGAPVGQIIYMLTKGYFQLLLFAIIVGVPLTFYVFSKWLESFAFSISLEYWMFIGPCLIVIIIAFSAVGMQSFRAATGNPVNALRQE